MKNNPAKNDNPAAFGQILLKNLFVLPAILIAAFLSAAANAQTVSLTSGGFVSVSGQLPGTPLSTQTAAGAMLDSRINFGDVVSNSGGRRVRITVPVRVSATTGYKIQLQRASAASGIQPQNIGFGVVNARPQTGVNPKLAAAATNLSINGNFGANPAAAPIINGSPRFAATFADIADSPTTVLTGVPTVADGALGEDDNSILIDLTFVIVPQYFEQSDLSALNLTLIIVPQP